MQLVADRFAIDDEGRAFDLATGEAVLLRRSSAGTRTEQLRWTLQHETWRTLQHRAVAPLVDFGVVGAASLFEAWSCGRAGSLTRIPDADDDYPYGSDEPTATFVPIERCGIRAIPRREIAILAELLEDRERTRPSVVSLWGPRGSGKTAAIAELARTARLNGFVPIAAHLVDTKYASLWAERSVFVAADEIQDRLWRPLLQSTLRSARPHVFLIASEHETRGVDGVRLKPIDPDALIASVWPASRDAHHDRRIRRAAERSRGLPGRFVELLWGAGGVPTSHSYVGSAFRRTSTGAPRVAEEASVYGEPVVVNDALAIADASTWPAPGELTTLRRRLAGAVKLIDEGRHAPGVRQLRQAIGGLARRHEWGSASEGSLVLASGLLRRGRPQEARDVLREAHDFAARSGRDWLLVDLARLDSEARIDLARLDEAESVLSTALATARGLSDRRRIGEVSIALARCLYWRGQFQDATDALASANPDALSATSSARHDLLASRIAVGEGNFGRAMSLATSAGGAARSATDCRSAAAAACCAALVHLGIGDLDAAERDLFESIAAARTARDPLRVVRARLLQAEVDRRRGRADSVSAVLKQLSRVAVTLPPILRVRLDTLHAIVRAGGEASEIVSRHSAASGLPALTLYLGRNSSDRVARSAGDWLVSDAVAIVRACQTAEDELVVLKDVCVRVRRQLHAASVAFVSNAGGRSEVAVCDGPRMDPTIAERAVTTGVTIAPHRCHDRIEAAAPVQYGGASVGAVCARWLLGSTYDLTRAAAVLEMTAAASAPMLSALLRRAQSPVAAVELLGVSPTINDLRRSVERASAAPFPILVEGESGSGKELVARAIHRLSARRERPFCTLNCAALPDDLIEAELFGHARGSFTGAVAERAGVFEEASTGTLLLDEIGELAPRAQAKVLRVIQEGELKRVGENLPRRVDVRVVAATNRDLRREAEAARFRMDLLYRLDVVRITVPALRDRREDIPLLADHFWRDITERLRSRATLGAETVAALARYDWPGNVRELQNVLASLAVRSPKRGVISPSALPPQFGAAGRTGAEDIWRLTEARRTFEQRFVRAALVRTGGHRGRAAAELGVTRQGLTKLMARLGIATDQRRTTNDERLTTSD